MMQSRVCSAGDSCPSVSKFRAGARSLHLLRCFHVRGWFVVYVKKNMVFDLRLWWQMQLTRCGEGFSDFLFLDAPPLSRDGCKKMAIWALARKITSFVEQMSATHLSKTVGFPFHAAGLVIWLERTWCILRFGVARSGENLPNPRKLHGKLKNGFPESLCVCVFRISLSIEVSSATNVWNAGHVFCVQDPGSGVQRITEATTSQLVFFPGTISS